MYFIEDDLSLVQTLLFLAEIANRFIEVKRVCVCCELRFLTLLTLSLRLRGIMISVSYTKRVRLWCRSPALFRKGNFVIESQLTVFFQLGSNGLKLWPRQDKNRGVKSRRNSCSGTS